MAMGMKDVLRKMRHLRTLYYKIQWKKEQHRIPKSERERSKTLLSSYRNKYSGQRCVIIGNGPSLRAEDLELLTDEITFASNRIFNLYDKTTWRPTFFCAQDDVVLESICEQLPEVSKESEMTILTASAYDSCKRNVEKVENLVWMPLRYIPPQKDRYCFSENAAQEVIEGLTITYSCMQLAAYMGFAEIYLLGIDHNYSIEVDKNGKIIKQDTSVKDYFAGSSVNKPGNPPQVVEMTYAYMSAEPYSREHGFRIFNATRGGKLEVFERRSFDEIFGQEKRGAL